MYTDSTTVDKILQFIRETGDALIKTGFAVAMKKVYADVAGELITAFLLLISVIFCFVLLKKVKNALDNGEDGDGYYFAMAGLIGINVIQVGLFSTSLISAVKMMVAPEWYALFNILGLFK